MRYIKLKQKPTYIYGDLPISRNRIYAKHILISKTKTSRNDFVNWILHISYYVRTCGLLIHSNPIFIIIADSDKFTSWSQHFGGVISSSHPLIMHSSPLAVRGEGIPRSVQK